MSGRVRIKICGITHPDDAEAAVAVGADLIGLNFVVGSPRFLELAAAEEIANRVAGRIDRVAVFKDAAPEEIERVLRRVDLERVQFHGSETEEEVEDVDLPVIKAIQGADVAAAEEFPGTILLLDHPTDGGGSGKTWNWSDATELIEMGVDAILAGGLDSDNVTEALSSLGDLLPWGVDVATGVEDEAGRKSSELMARFVEAVRAAENFD